MFEDTNNKLGLLKREGNVSQIKTVMIKLLNELYESHCNLWDSYSSDNYTNRNARILSMEEIADHFLVSAQGVKDKTYNIHC